MTKQRQLNPEIEAFLEGVIEDLPGEAMENGLWLRVNSHDLLNYLRDILELFAKQREAAALLTELEARQK